MWHYNSKWPPRDYFRCCFTSHPPPRTPPPHMILILHHPQLTPGDCCCFFLHRMIVISRTILLRLLFTTIYLLVNFASVCQRMIVISRTKHNFTATSFYFHIVYWSVLHPSVRSLSVVFDLPPIIVMQYQMVSCGSSSLYCLLSMSFLFWIETTYYSTIDLSQFSCLEDSRKPVTMLLPSHFHTPNPPHNPISHDTATQSTTTKRLSPPLSPFHIYPTSPTPTPPISCATLNLIAGNYHQETAATTFPLPCRM